MNNGSVNVGVRTQAHENGEIQGVISLSSGANESKGSVIKRRNESIAQ